MRPAAIVRARAAASNKRMPGIPATIEHASDRVSGRTLRFAWTEGPTAGKTHEHRFHADGTVEWRGVGAGHDEPSGGAPAASAERPPYLAVDVGRDATFVSYLSGAGFTLSVVIDFAARTIVGVASNDRQWHPVRGRLEP